MPVIMFEKCMSPLSIPNPSNVTDTRRDLRSVNDGKNLRLSKTKLNAAWTFLKRWRALWLGTSANLWLNLQKHYELRLAEKEIGREIRSTIISREQQIKAAAL